jgi:hypothetical protein
MIYRFSIQIRVQHRLKPLCTENGIILLKTELKHPKKLQKNGFSLIWQYRTFLPETFEVVEIEWMPPFERIFDGDFKNVKITSWTWFIGEKTNPFWSKVIIYFATDYFPVNFNREGGGSGILVGGGVGTHTYPWPVPDLGNPYQGNGKIRVRYWCVGVGTDTMTTPSPFPSTWPLKSWSR